MNINEIKKYLSSLEVEKKFQEIAAWYKVDNSSLKQIIDQILSGEISTSDLAAVIGEKFSFDFNTALKVALDLKKKILRPIEADLNKINEQLSTASWQEFTPDHLVQELLSKLADWQLKDDNLKKRFSDALISYLRDIRDSFELKEILMRPVKIGGIGMPEAVYNQLYSLLIEKKNEIEAQGLTMDKIMAEYSALQGNVGQDIADVEIDVGAKTIAPSQPEKIVTQQVSDDKFLQSNEVKVPKAGPVIKTSVIVPDLAAAISKREQELEAEEELMPPTPAPQAQSKSSFIDRLLQEEAAKKTPALEFAAKPSNQVSTALRSSVMPNSNMSSRPKIDDVKFTPRLIGPIEELESITLNDLRRLARDPQEAAAKIMAKIDLLEEESINKRTEGIQALKRSPLYKIYAEIMSQALTQGKSFDQILTESKALTSAELKAVMDLNKNLKY